MPILPWKKSDTLKETWEAGHCSVVKFDSLKTVRVFYRGHCTKINPTIKECLDTDLPYGPITEDTLDQAEAFLLKYLVNLREEISTVIKELQCETITI